MADDRMPAVQCVLMLDKFRSRKKNKGRRVNSSALVDGAPGEIRTPDHQVRSLVLYPAELRAQKLEAKLCVKPLVSSNIFETVKLAETEGFEPSMELLTPYSLSRGAPSASRASLRGTT